MDARWIEVDADTRETVEYFRQAAQLFDLGGFDAAGLEGFKSKMAFMHAMQCGHTSLESALVRILKLLREAKPEGENWHADLIERARTEIPGNRPAIFSTALAAAADETRRFRSVATRGYGRDFSVTDAAKAVASARKIVADLPAEISVFKVALDPTPAPGDSEPTPAPSILRTRRPG